MRKPKELTNFLLGLRFFSTVLAHKLAKCGLFLGIIVLYKRNAFSVIDLFVALPLDGETLSMWVYLGRTR